MRRFRPLASLAALLVLCASSIACSSSGDEAEGGGESPGSGGQSGGGAGSAGKAGKGGAAGGQAGQAGLSGAGGSSGKAGQAGAGGSSGNAGQAGAGGQAGASGKAGSGGQAGSAGSGGSGGQAAGAGGSSGKGGQAGQAGQAGAGGGGQAGQGGAGGGPGGQAGAGGGCTDGDPCEGGGVCAGGECCPAPQACGATCCGATDVCSFQKCVTPGAACADPTECGPDEYCELSLGSGGSGGTAGAGGSAGQCQGGSSKSGKCLPRPPLCEGSGGGPQPGGPITCLEKCEYHPPKQAFTPELKYAWGGKTSAPFDTDVMMTPIVIELDDDDCDGKITERDIPEIVFSTFSGCTYTSGGKLHAISIVGGEVVEKWSLAGINPYGPVAGGNIDAQPGNEIIACGDDGRVHALAGATGSELWVSAPMTCAFPSIADLDGDGVPEVIVHGGVLDGKTGALKASFSTPIVGTFAISDLDGDGKLDIVTTSQAFHGDGTQFIDTGATGYTYPYPGFQHGPAIADFDKDGVPEVVGTYFQQHRMTVWHYDPSAPGKFAFVRNNIDINGTLSPSACPPNSAGSKTGGGPATVGDFNADGVPDVALAGGVGYAVFDGKKLVDKAVADVDTFLWIKQTQDCSSAGTGSSLFDFDGDGKAEVVYADETHLRVYEGATGNVLWETCNTSGTLTEYPLVADVDNDGHADIVAVSNACFTPSYPAIACNDGKGSSQAGVRVFGDKEGRWVRTRRIWNEHAYHVTNVGEDGTIPAHEQPNWLQPGLNNFRQNKQPGSEFSAPDAVVSVRPICPGSTFVATVRNLGEAALEAGVTVNLYKGSPPGVLLTSAATTTTLAPAQAELLSFTITDADVLGGNVTVYAELEVSPSAHECRTDNNTSPSTYGCVKP